MINDYYTTSFSTFRPVWTTDDDDNSFSEEQSVGTFNGQLQQANAELVASLGLSFTKAFTIWCDVATDVKEGDTLYSPTDKYSVRAVMKNNIGQNRHLEIVVQLEASQGS